VVPDCDECVHLVINLRITQQREDPHMGLDVPHGGGGYVVWVRSGVSPVNVLLISDMPTNGAGAEPLKLSLEHHEQVRFRVRNINFSELRSTGKGPVAGYIVSPL
jgi:hypothetical protein